MKKHSFAKALAILAGLFVSEAGWGSISGLQATSDTINANYQYSFTGTPRFHQVYLDTDQNAGTGYSSNGLGSEFLVENGILYRYSGNGSTWSWSQVQSVSFSKTTTVAKWSVPRAALGPVSGIRVIARTDNPLAYSTAVSQVLSGSKIIVSASSDASNAYYKMTYSGTPQFYQIYLDTDRNAASGYTIGGLGADLLIENSVLYRHSGSGGSWGWTQLQSISMSNASGVVNWTAPRSALGSSSSIQLIGRVDNPESLSDQMTQNFSTAPAPSPTPAATPAATPTPTATPRPTATPTPAPSGPVKAFPGAQGFGTSTKAGRGGQLLRVTNLNDSGAGSLRAALEAVGPRIVVFEVSGTIALTDVIRIRSPFVTVAGQTAPSPGITLRNAGLQVETSDVLIQHLRIRVGDTTSRPIPNDRDAIAVLGPNVQNVVIDHVSASWAVDENMSTWYQGVKDVTFSNCIISEGLNNSLKGEPHSKGLIIGDHAKTISVIGNLFAHNGERQPLVKGDVSALIANNVSYNVGFHTDTEILDNTEYGPKPSIASIVSNVYIKGPNTRTDYKGFITYGTAAGFKLYHSDNKVVNGSVFVNFLSYNPIVSTPPVWLTPLSLLPSSSVETSVLAKAGARPKDRDSVDTRVVNEVRNRQGRIIDSQNQVGGWPSLANNRRAFVAPNNPNGDDDGDGYTNLEEILHQMAAAVE